MGNLILEAITQHARKKPQAIALQGNTTGISYASLKSEIAATQSCMKKNKLRRIGLLMDNGPAWAVVDLAAMTNKTVVVPLAGFFSDEQLSHVIKSASLDTIITDNPARLVNLLPEARLRPRARIAGQNIWHLSLPESIQQALPEGTVKITFTSGTTGAPKGVCLTQHTIINVALSLSNITTVNDNDRHVCLLPMSVLLENVAGLYAALLRGVPCILPSLSELGTTGSRTLDFIKLFSLVRQQKATSIILIPELLQALLAVVENGIQLPDLRFIAVGGASVSPSLLEKAQALGLPVYEGYGLSECASVVAVNTPDAMRRGSVGKPLPHVHVTIAPDNEIMVAGPSYAGYLNDKPGNNAGLLPTGDLGYIDDDGYLYVTGRKKNLFITSFGRNVSPEWIEREIQAQPVIEQTVVYGESRPWNVAIIVPRDNASSQQIDAAIKRVNYKLPDYAQISQWLLASEPFTPANGQYTVNGRPRRDVIWSTYARQIDQLYTSATLNSSNNPFVNTLEI